MRFVRRAARFVFSRRGLVLLVAIVAIFVWLSWPDDRNIEAFAKHYDTTAVAADLIPPGTVIGNTAPQGWSRLVVKSLPRVALEHRGKVTSLMVRKAEQQFAAFLADVGPEEGTMPPRYRIRAFAVGMGRRVGDQDMVLSPDSAKQFGADMDWIDRQVLETSYKRQQGARVLIRSETFALADAPVPFHCGERHKMVAFRYALLVDEATGRLDVLNWWVDADGQCTRDPQFPAMVILPPDLINEPFLYVDEKELKLFGALPTDVAFAVNRLPAKGIAIDVPSELWPLADQLSYQPDAARRLEGDLRRLLPESRPALP